MSRITVGATAVVGPDGTISSAAGKSGVLYRTLAGATQITDVLDASGSVVPGGVVTATEDGMCPLSQPEVGAEQHCFVSFGGGPRQVLHALDMNGGALDPATAGLFDTATATRNKTDARYSKKGDVIYAADYGVIGDGTTDSTSGMEAAIAAASGKMGRRIVLPAGLIKVFSTLNITSSLRNLIIEGEGDSRPEITGGTCINFYGTGPLFQIGSDNGHAYDAAEYDGPQGFTLRDIMLRANSGTEVAIGDGQAGGVTYFANTYGVRDWRGGNVRFENVRVERFETGFWGISSDFNSWRNVDIFYCKVGMYLGPRCDQGLYSGVNFYGCRRALEIARAQVVKFDLPTFVNCGNLTTIPVKISPGGYSIGGGSIVLDQPWFEQFPDYVAGTFESYVEIGDDSAVAVGAVEIRQPLFLHNRFSDGSISTFAHMLKVGNISHHLVVTNPSGFGCANFSTSFVKAFGSSSPVVVIEGPNNTVGLYPRITNAGTGSPKVVSVTFANGRWRYITSPDGEINLAPQAATSDLKDALIAIGLLTAGGATPLDLDGGRVTAGHLTLAATGTSITLGNGTGDTAILEAKAGTVLVNRVGGVNIHQTNTDALQIYDGKNLKFGTVTGSMVASDASQKMGFWGATPIARPTVTGSKASGAALDSLLTTLATMGLIVDGTTA